MGEVANDIRSGIVCELCGIWMEDMFIYNKKGETIGVNQPMWDNPPGYPRRCKDCKKEK